MLRWAKVCALYPCCRRLRRSGGAMISLAGRSCASAGRSHGMMVRTLKRTNAPAVHFFSGASHSLCVQLHATTPPTPLHDAHHGGLLFPGVENEVQQAPVHARAAARPVDSARTAQQDARRLYNTLTVLAWLLDVISPLHHWKQRLKTLLAQHSIDLQRMGFPADWAQRALWQEKP